MALYFSFGFVPLINKNLHQYFFVPTKTSIRVKKYCILLQIDLEGRNTHRPVDCKKNKIKKYSTKFNMCRIQTWQSKSIATLQYTQTVFPDVHSHSFRIITATTEQMLLISENPGTLSQSLFHQKQSSNFIMLPSVNTLVCLETGKGPCDFIICSQREPEQTSWQGDYFGIWIPLSNYYAIPGGLIYCIPRYPGHSGKKIVAGKCVCVS